MNRILILISTLAMVGLGCSNDGASGSGASEPPPASEQIKKAAPSADANAISTETNIKAPQWVADLLNANVVETRVIKCVHEGKNLYLINTCISCPTQLTEVFNDQQEMVCRIGGADMKITCEESLFGEEGKRNCKPVYIKGKEQF